MTEEKREVSACQAVLRYRPPPWRGPLGPIKMAPVMATQAHPRTPAQRETLTVMPTRWASRRAWSPTNGERLVCFRTRDHNQVILVDLI